MKRTGKLWSVLRFPLTRILLGAAAVIGSTVPIQLGAWALGIEPESPAGLAVAAVVALVAAFAYVGYVRLIEGRPVVELGRAGAARELGVGFALGVLVFSVSITLLWAAGACTLTLGDGVVAMLAGLAAAVVAAVVEEIVVRGVLYRILQESLGTWIALALSAAIFGLLHAFNPGATATSSAAIAFEAGLLLAAAYLYSGRLWLPIGMHAAWNFSEGGVFGASVSGTEAHGLLASHFHGPDWLTGGDFGPEASVVPVVLCVATACGFLVLARRRHRFVPPFWRRPRATSG